MGLLSQFLRFVIFQILQDDANTGSLFVITIIFDRCYHSWAVVTPVKYERDFKNVTCVLYDCFEFNFEIGAPWYLRLETNAPFCRINAYIADPFACFATSSFLSQCCLVVNWTAANNFRWNLNQNITLLSKNDRHIELFFSIRQRSVVVISIQVWHDYCPV